MVKDNKKRIYLDHAANTPVDDSVRLLMNKTYLNNFHNPGVLYEEGVRAMKLINEAKKSIGNILHAKVDEIIFTGSGTESDNLGILGVVNYFKNNFKTNNKANIKNRIPHIVTTNIEHPAVREVCLELNRSGVAEVTFVPVDEKGIIDPKEIKKALKENTILVSVMYANNEIGTIQPIEEVAKVVRHFKKENKSKLVAYGYPYLHTDACQAVNYLPLNIEKLGVDLLTFNSSKIYGPKGIGVLFKKRGLLMKSIMFGGSQEWGMRPGTENTPAILGLAKALEIAENIKEKESRRLTVLRDYFINQLEKNFSNIIINGDKIKRLPNNINVSFPGINSELLVIYLDAYGVLISSKSACKESEEGESYVIKALRESKKKEVDFGNIRFSLGPSTTKSDIDKTLKVLKEIVKKLTINNKID